MVLDKKALLKYLSALLLFGLNGIVASQIAMSSYEIVMIVIASVTLVLALIEATKGDRK